MKNLVAYEIQFSRTCNALSHNAFRFHAKWQVKHTTQRDRSVIRWRRGIDICERWAGERASGHRIPWTPWQPLFLTNINAFSAAMSETCSVYLIEGVMTCLSLVRAEGLKHNSDSGNGKLKMFVARALFASLARENGRIVCHIYGLTFSMCHSWPPFRTALPLLPTMH